MLIDTHAHPLHRLYADVPALAVADYLNQAKAAGVGLVLGVACRREEWAPMLDVAAQNEALRVIAGIHPHDADEAVTETELVGLATSPLVVALGETGFDFYYDNLPDLATQEASFRRHCTVALTHGLPVVIHTRNADADTVRVLRDYPGLAFVLHCFSGSPWLAEQGLALGGYLSFSGMLTFGKKSAELCEIATQAPRDRVLLETDAPYLAPAPQRGQRNDSSLLPHTATALATMWQCNTAEVAELTTTNARRLFTRLA